MNTTKPKFQSRKILLGSASGMAVALSLVLTGCGGGGGGGVSPSPTNTPIPTGNGVSIQLRDTSNLPVDGLVTVASQTKATSGGNVSFSNVPSGVQTVEVEVNGRTYTQSIVVTSGSQTVVVSIDPTVPATPVPTSPPNPPT